jgi:transposase
VGSGDGRQVSEVARQNGISPKHLFQWRRAAREGQLVLALDDDVAFAAVMAETAVAPRPGGS